MQNDVEIVTSSTKITPQTEAMLLSYMFALCLRVDDYATDTTLLAKDLGMAVTKYVPSHVSC